MPTALSMFFILLQLGELGKSFRNTETKNILHEVIPLMQIILQLPYWCSECNNISREINRSLRYHAPVDNVKLFSLQSNQKLQSWFSVKDDHASIIV